MIYYPSGTLLCNHRCVQLRPEFGMTSLLIGVLGELRETTEGGDVNEAGASTVKVRSSDVKFDA